MTISQGYRVTTNWWPTGCPKREARDEPATPEARRRGMSWVPPHVRPSGHALPSALALPECSHEHVLHEIESWPVDILADSARLTELLMDHGPNLRLPHSRAFGDGLFELSPRGRAGIGRAFYCFLVGKRVVVLHVFIKKSQETPDRKIYLARKRMKEVPHD